MVARHQRSSCVPVAVAAAALVGVAPVHAARPRPPQDASSITQYVEAVPTAGGGQAVGVGATRSKQLPPRIERQLDQEAGASAGALRKVATSSAYGAPQKRLRPATTKRPVRPDPAEPTKAGGPSVVAAGVRAAGSGGSTRAIALLLALMAGITIAAVAAAVR